MYSNGMLWLYSSQSSQITKNHQQKTNEKLLVKSFLNLDVFIQMVYCDYILRSQIIRKHIQKANEKLLVKLSAKPSHIILTDQRQGWQQLLKIKIIFTLMPEILLYKKQEIKRNMLRLAFMIWIKNNYTEFEFEIPEVKKVINFRNNCNT